jgi:hypothetical protein
LSEPPQSDKEEAHDVLIDVATKRAIWIVESQLEDSAVYDLKALGLLAVDAAALTVLVGAHSSLNHLWVISLLLLLAAGILLCLVVWPTGYELGPDAEEFYAENMNSATVRQIRERMLSELLEAVNLNDPSTPRKDIRLRCGFVLLVAGVLVGLAFALFPD